MRCSGCTESLTAYIDRELNDPEAGEVKDHLSTCPDCASQYTSLVLTTAAAGKLSAIEPSPELWTRIRADIVRARVSQPEPKTQWWPLWLPQPWALASLSAGTLVLVMTVTFWPTSSPMENRFAQFLEKRERVFQEHREILFSHEWADKYRQVRNPFSRPVTLVDYNPFQE